MNLKMQGREGIKLFRPTRQNDMLRLLLYGIREKVHFFC
jgi:hypothetical protein